jgi:hypothetical protein
MVRVYKGFVVGLCGIALVGCGDIHSMFDSGLQGSGVSSKETRTAKDFTKVEAGGSAQIQITVGPSYSVAVEGDNNIVPLIETTVDGDKLVIHNKKSISPKLDLVVKITMPHLDGVSLSGATTTQIEGVNEDKLQLDTSGASNVTIKGKAKNLDLSISGAGSVKADELETDYSKVEVSGAGNASVWADSHLDATAQGAGTIRYKGSPKNIGKSIDGAGSIEKE